MGVYEPKPINLEVITHLRGGRWFLFQVGAWGSDRYVVLWEKNSSDPNLHFVPYGISEGQFLQRNPDGTYQMQAISPEIYRLGRVA